MFIPNNTSGPHYTEVIPEVKNIKKKIYNGRIICIEIARSGIEMSFKRLTVRFADQVSMARLIFFMKIS